MISNKKYIFFLVFMPFFISCDDNIFNNSKFSVIKDSLFPTVFNTSIPFSLGGPAVGGTGQVCGVTKASQVLCWGENSLGQLGNGSFIATHLPQTVVGGDSGSPYLSSIIKVVSGRSNVCAININGDVYCWGQGGFALGTGNDTEPNSNFPRRVVTGEQAHSSGFLSNIVDLAVGFSFVCALDGTGRVYCWGVGTNGRLGYGSLANSSQPRAVLGGEQGGLFLNDIVQISVGRANSCGSTSSGSLYCWGDRRGLGTGLPATDQQTPVQVLGGAQGGPFLSNVQRVSVGWNRACALIQDGSVYCWGYSNGGTVLGTGIVEDGPTPLRVIGGAQGSLHLQGIIQLAHNFVADTCAITQAEELFCWGSGFGLSPTSVPSGEQSSEPFLENIKLIMPGPAFFCWIDQEDKTYCLGANASGQLGFDPSIDGTSIPLPRHLNL